MENNLKRYKDDLSKLVVLGDRLECAFQYSYNKVPFVELYTSAIKKQNPKKTTAQQKKLINEFFNGLPSVSLEYQNWYSEALEVIRQLIPQRLDDFASHYKKPKTKRKDITFENYVIEDALQGLRITKGWDKELVVDASASIPRFQQQLAILKSAKARFESSLFDIIALVTSDILDSELSAAEELHKHKFYRASGMICGVVLEKHLGAVCGQHNIKFRKQNLTIADFNEALKKDGVIDTPKWRHIQFLGDIRNKCGHNKSSDPTKEDVQDLIDGTSKVIKTIF